METLLVRILLLRWLLRLKVSAPSDETFIGSVVEHIRKRARIVSGLGHMYVETAGGVHSPTLSRTTQLDTYRTLFLPAILIRDSRLGSISSTISVFESLLLHGYIIDVILLFWDEYYRNYEYLTHIYDASSGKTSPLQSKSLLQPQLDGSASWWMQAVGRAHPTLALAAANAAGHYGHIMFLQATHIPALKLAECLLQGPGKGWASRVFFLDNGSTGMEVALKMALQSFIVSSGLKLSSLEKKNLRVVGLQGSYHGDMIGAMDACEEGVYTCEWHEAKGYWFEPPTLSNRQGQVTISLPPALSSLTSDQRTIKRFETLSHVYDVEQHLKSPLAKHYRQYLNKHMRSLQADDTQKLAALIIEPIVLGTGGMIFVDPLFQRFMVNVVRHPAIFGCITTDPPVSKEIACQILTSHVNHMYSETALESQ
ncbi:pyridoxal phosphate-dependent transferase [Suillus fuscotomentosus]|uniref:Pyridoxal phosphate-dependent transferase n=1 Tax=Suillus fuscotomentosus TaxID=1912939 RepID=A0AAD4E6P9_9AGAM|nr:pyridoxal phosphate-dependent transferase [Suillus fuscotomentosus]KAG1899343.1 pyridoxal phosphate-dependent transferase [Suillus fuscotomentosus]